MGEAKEKAKMSFIEDPSDTTRIGILERRLDSLEKISDTNAAVFSDSLQLTELCIQALQRAFDDHISGVLKTITLEPAKCGGDGNDFEAFRLGLPVPADKPAKMAVDFKAYLRDAHAASLETAKMNPVRDGAEPSAQPMFEFGG